MAVGVVEAAALMNVGVSTVYRLLSRGELARLKLGHRTLIRRSDLEAFLTSLEVKGRG
ncbi:MAG: helix-turn-helix domain-containing protein [Phreatobacter sp.]|nr:helix-turn-helix domain-containing protein [Phreatobacter sp.]